MTHCMELLMIMKRCLKGSAYQSVSLNYNAESLVWVVNDNGQCYEIKITPLNLSGEAKKLQEESEAPHVAADGSC